MVILSTENTNDTVNHQETPEIVPEKPVKKSRRKKLNKNHVFLEAGPPTKNLGILEEANLKILGNVLGTIGNLGNLGFGTWGETK